MSVPKISVSILLLLMLSSIGSVEGQSPRVRRVLILIEAGTSRPAVNITVSGIREELENSSYRMDVYEESLDKGLFPAPAEQRAIRDFVRFKYRDRQPDVIITVGPSPLRFMLEEHHKGFPGVPIVFCVPSISGESDTPNDPDITGVENTLAPLETLNVALKLQPGTRHVFVIGGTSAYDRQQEAIVKKGLTSYESQLDISYLTDLSMADLLEHLRHLPGQSLVLFTSLDRDSNGTHFISGTESAPMVAAAANAPVFSLYDFYINHGEVGGDLASLKEQGRIAATMALRTLGGERPSNIPRTRAVSRYVFDWRAIERWRLEERGIPRGSQVLNRKPTLWESYSWYIVGALSVVLFEGVLIGGLLWQRSRRRRAERELAAAFDAVRESEERFRLIANSAPVMIWMSDATNTRTYFNQTWLDFTGRSLAIELGGGWMASVHPDDLHHHQRSSTRCEAFTMEYRLRDKDGNYRWIVDSGVPRLDSDSRLLGFTGCCVDVTEHKLAQEALSTVSRKLIEAHEEERSRVARELHDNINQRLALIAVQLDIAKMNAPRSGRDVKRLLTEVQDRITEISTEVHAVAHEYHSSTLEYIGIVAVSRKFCNEFAAAEGVEVIFASGDVPGSMPPAASLCVFRVLQESLRNAAKHTDAQRFDVRLACSANQLHLTVSDCGKGFEVETASRNGGLGLTSMRERVRSVHGTISICSTPMKGTSIEVRVPLFFEHAWVAGNGAVPCDVSGIAETATQRSDEP